ncbi:MAG: hypothetical protein UY21_C0007G0015 [Microgenomates group bacterium GW2011_GWA1_48_10]|uniref:SpoVT-AbrB domain-containing protein n=1 Tax=Candidatus Gottesmanbacteria bacterium RIFCSPHIGHO2_01_FULL_47_48 TaxID=1798381 RepID=A0A1F6A2R4_9BACT|nr:MAG: hypothetical protein UY21_C0007G0015 [Microgenomates group bacterium GW2011_GWA1_48_10]OGG18961.1 MAG: hypothetical protein A2721_02370 [Candidatus Gottesmanbacteria bacterium RIFCSPHIGHO2_01_FULL_47_48]
MTYTASVTSQGQVSIPAPFRKKYGLSGNKVIFEETVDGGLKLKPVPDIMSLAGIFKTKKRFTHEQERGSFRHYLATRHLGNKLT